MSGDGLRWVYDPGDSFAHVLADPPAAASVALVTVCGRELPAERTPTFPVAPSLAVCPACEPTERAARPPVAFPPMPDGARGAGAREGHALNRAHEGAVVKLGGDCGDYVDAGCPVADYLADTFDELIATGLLGLGPPSAGGSRRVCVHPYRTGPAKRHHRRPRVTGVEVGEQLLIEVTDAHTGDAHLVTDDAVRADRHTGSYAALCGDIVLAASLTAPEEGHCRRCARR
ncbi:MAG: hypothetical protein ACRDTE_32730, partial [Pseudonocardiaceae bacterium]